MKKIEEIVPAEWRDIKYMSARFGVGTTTLYAHVKSGDIQSVLLKIPGRKQGKRLFNVKSAENLFASLSNGSMGPTPWSNASEK